MPYSQEFITHQKQVLTEIFDRLTDQSSSRVEKHQASSEDDLGSLEDEVNTFMCLRSHDREFMLDVTAALKRLDQGTYGICELSGQPIPIERLEAVPWARYTVLAQEVFENKRKIRKNRAAGYGLAFDDPDKVE
jgi:RNA polymerase-binding protein DksA